MLQASIAKDDAALRELDALLQRLQNPRPLFEKIGALLEANAQRRFDEKRGPSGAKWRPWALSTAKQRAKEPWASLMEHTGLMRSSLFFQASTHSVLVGFGVDYAAEHELGDVGKSLPARPLLTFGNGLGPEDTRDVLDAVRSYLQ